MLRRVLACATAEVRALAVPSPGTPCTCLSPASKLNNHLSCHPGRPGVQSGLSACVQEPRGPCPSTGSCARLPPQEVKAALKQMQDEQLFSQLAPALERNPHAVASPLRARPAGGTPGRRGKPVGRRGGRGGRGGPGGHGGRAAAAAAGGSEALAASGRAEGKQQQEVQHQPGVQPQGDVLAEAASPARDDSDLEGANEGLGADRQAQRPGMPAAARAGAVAGGAAAAPAAAAAGTPPGAAELFRQLRAVRQSGEEMALELEAALLLTPGLKARHVAAFLARCVCVRVCVCVCTRMLCQHALCLCACTCMGCLLADVWRGLSECLVMCLIWWRGVACVAGQQLSTGRGLPRVSLGQRVPQRQV